MKKSLKPSSKRKIEELMASIEIFVDRKTDLDAKSSCSFDQDVQDAYDDLKRKITSLIEDL